MNIVIVDDSENGRLILKKTLSAAGHHVRESENGLTALALAMQDPPDMIISDILMPEMDGFQFCRLVRLDETLKQIPFIFYTATYTDSRDEKLALAIGADRFIRKPLDSQDFLAAIQTITRDVSKGRIEASDVRSTIVYEYDLLVYEKLHHYEARLSPAGNSQVLAVIRDLTEQRLLEQQFLQAQKMESVGQLAGGVAHDFKNMLSIITGYAELALNKLNELDPLRKDLNEIRNAAMRSADLVRQLPAFAWQQAICPQVLDLNMAVNSSLNMLGRLIGEDIQMEFKPAENLWSVKMDPAQVNQILTNLAVNARDAIGGTGNLLIETANISLDEPYCRLHHGFMPGDYVALKVSDTGSGMTREVLDKIFEPFFTTKGEGKGTGLGLSTVYGIVKQNDGFINAYSEPGLGTTFKLFFPRHEGKAEAFSAPVEKRPASGHETILIVEDEEMILDLCNAILMRQGYKVLSASSPGEAILLCETHSGPVDLLITDVVMPAMNGMELKKRITDSRPGIRALFMSGYTSDIIAHRGVLAEGAHFIQKPFSVDGLSRKVREVLDEKIDL